jgi:hypothetical protein
MVMYNRYVQHLGTGKKKMLNSAIKTYKKEIQFIYKHWITQHLRHITTI